jgi:hydroxymethylpyrimidine pyrophosphatase-like HAD family hydrolase
MEVYCRAIACDFDGTGATEGRPAPEVYAARAQGIVTLLVTGRVLEEVQRACEDVSPFDAVVAENGAVISWRRTADLNCATEATEISRRTANPPG